MAGLNISFYYGSMVRFLVLALFFIAMPVMAAEIIIADGRWAAIRRDNGCEAAALALRPAAQGREPGRLSIVFAPKRSGELVASFSRPVRPGSSLILTINDQPFLLIGSGDRGWSRGPAQEAAIMTALRRGGWARVESSSPQGGRMIDHYELVGAARAIDAAALCWAVLANQAKNR